MEVEKKWELGGSNMGLIDFWGGRRGNTKFDTGA